LTSSTLLKSMMFQTKCSGSVVSPFSANSLQAISVGGKTKTLQKRTLLCRHALERVSYTSARLSRNQVSQPASSTSYVQISLNMGNLTRSCADFLSFQSEVTELTPDQISRRRRRLSTAEAHLASAAPSLRNGYRPL
jgi:hypothetical protein